MAAAGLAAVMVAYLVVTLWPSPEPLDLTPVISPDAPARFTHVEPPSFTRYGR